MNNSKRIQREAIAKSGLPKNKYNFSMHNDTEHLTGEPSDVQESDAGMEPEVLTNNE